ncbi:hypothetical protein XH93_11090 [Bradyrhizobium sp. CCBAU 51753]|nr:hypothetical protein XH93_11090 [Bradyrhizobium sp. CCBAU 51753]
MLFIMVPLIFLTMSMRAPRAEAQNLTVQEWVDQFVASCVGSGSSDVASGLVDANGDISLKRLALSGTVKGQVHIEHKDARLLSDGINNAISNAAAGVAEQVRQCMAPLRAVLIQIMQSQFQGVTGPANKVYILTAPEDQLMKQLANTKGYFGKIGEAVLVSQIQSAAGMSDVRYRSAMKLLTDKAYAYERLDLGQGKTASLLPPGDEYALRVGFAK